MDEILGKNLMELRKSKKLDAKTVAEKTGLTESQVKSIEFAIKSPTDEELAKLAQFYGVDTATLYVKDSQQSAPVQPTVPVSQTVSVQPIIQEQPQQPAGIPANQNMISEVNMSKNNSNQMPQQPYPQQPYPQQPYPQGYPQYPPQGYAPYPPQYAGPVQYQEKPRKFPLALLVAIGIFSIATIVSLFLPFFVLSGSSTPLYKLLLPDMAEGFQAFLTTYFFNVQIIGVIVYWLIVALVIGAALDILMMILLFIPAIRRSFVSILEKIFVILFGILSLLGFIVVAFFFVFEIIQTEGQFQIVTIMGSYSFMVFGVAQLITFILKMCAAPRVFKVRKEPKQR